MSASAVAPAQTQKQSIPANQSLYITNLNDKIAKPDLRRALYTLFATYGPVLDVVALKTSKMRGQAHIVYRDVQTSSQAMRALQGFEFFGKKMSISYAKGKSNQISKLDGSAKMPESKEQASVSTELQKSIFGAPPPAKPAAPAAAGLPKPPTTVPAEEDAATPQGVKRRRDEDSDEEGAPMEEDDDEAAMDVSDED